MASLVANALNVSPAASTGTLMSVLAEHGWRVMIEDEGPGVPAE